MHLTSRLAIGFLLFSVNLSQAQQDHSELYQFFDKNVGAENTLLYNGIENIDLQRTIDDANKFLLKGRDFEKGSLVYDGQFFPEVPMRFNLVDDEIIVSLKNDQENSIFKLIKEKVERFTLDDRDFVFIPANANSEISEGFFQELYKSGNFEVFKKYLKREFKILDRTNPYYRYEVIDPEYYMKYDKSYYKINSWKDLATHFPSFKKDIRKFYKDNKQLRKEDPDRFTTQLFTEVTRLTTNANL